LHWSDQCVAGTLWSVCIEPGCDHRIRMCGSASAQKPGAKIYRFNQCRCVLHARGIGRCLSGQCVRGISQTPGDGRGWLVLVWHYLQRFGRGYARNSLQTSRVHHFCSDCFRLEFLGRRRAFLGIGGRCCCHVAGSTGARLTQRQGLRPNNGFVVVVPIIDLVLNAELNPASFDFHGGC